MVKKEYLNVAFRSNEQEDNLKIIEVLNMPARQEKDSEDYVADHEISSFFELFVADELFRRNRTLSLYSFESLKIWLHATPQRTKDENNPLVPVQLPSTEAAITDAMTTTLTSHLSASELKQIMVLDIGLSGNQRVLWQDACKELLTPLFGKFIPPPQPPAVLTDFLTIKFGAKLSGKLDLYLSMRKHICFDALVVQAK